MNLDQHHNAFLTMIGLTLVRWEPGLAEFDLLVDHRHTNRQGVLQGGLLATILKAASRDMEDSEAKDDYTVL